jgi:hypothetical protein
MTSLLKQPSTSYKLYITLAVQHRHVIKNYVTISEKHTPIATVGDTGDVLALLKAIALVKLSTYKLCGVEC